MHRFHLIFRIRLPQENLELMRFLEVSVVNCCHNNTKDLWVLKFVGVPQPKPIFGFSPNLPDMLSEKVSTAI